MEFYMAVKKKKKILSSATVWMDLENIVQSEISQSEKDKYHMISLICGMQWTNLTNKENGDRLLDEEQGDSCGWGGKG